MSRKKVPAIVYFAKVAQIVAQFRKTGQIFTVQDILAQLSETCEPSIYIGPTYTIYDYLDELEWEGLVEKIGRGKYRFCTCSK